MLNKKDHSRRSLARQEGKRQEFTRILIVSEGKKTEPLYFQGLKQKLRLSSVDCKIVPLIGDRNQIKWWAMLKIL